MREREKDIPDIPEQALYIIARRLLSRRRDVVYPIELVVVPRYIFTKVPMIEWRNLQRKSVTDSEVVDVKYRCSKLGCLINVGFVLRNFVLIDVECYDENVRSKLRASGLFDVETRRGFHKYFYLPDAVSIAVGQRTPKGESWTTKKVLDYRNLLGIKIEVMSGYRYLGSYPPQSRYLVFSNNTVSVKCYRVLSKEFQHVVDVGDLTEIAVKDVDYIHEFLCNIARVIGDEGVAKQIKTTLSIRRVESDEEYEKIQGIALSDVKPREDEVNLGFVGTLTYDEFKELLSKAKHVLPPCIVKCFLGEVEEGYRYAMCRLACVVAPALVYLDEQNLEKMIVDFAERYGFRKPRDYYWKYFTAEDKELGVRSLSAVKVPKDVFEMVRQYVRCDEECMYRDVCYMYNLYVRGIEAGKPLFKIVAEVIESVYRPQAT